MTGFGKIDHLCIFIALRNINLKYSYSYNSALVSGRSMGLAPEIEHVIAQVGVIIADHLLCEAFIGMAVISGVALIWGEIGGEGWWREATGIQ